MAKKESPGAALVRKRWEKSTQKERSAAASKASQARWAEVRKKKESEAK